eukprot:TRINITY_DN39405_c0_g1_i1.p1 TRINITY_DN39405_c0_g1~~TRINITY_DN39405_c0_g1_i1.p1  ORF type:complete len:992 (+),score=211.99 TRINITY_DN39405_c0_g1_i1:55-3030(+)
MLGRRAVEAGLAAAGLLLVVAYSSSEQRVEGVEAMLRKEHAAVADRPADDDASDFAASVAALWAKLDGFLHLTEDEAAPHWGVHNALRQPACPGTTDVVAGVPLCRTDADGCVVYDFRSEKGFGRTLAERWKCDVVTFGEAPASAEGKHRAVQGFPAAHDGAIELWYTENYSLSSWRQGCIPSCWVPPLTAEPPVANLCRVANSSCDCAACSPSDETGVQRPGVTLKNAMRRHRHTSLDVLYVRGSGWEAAFLERALDDFGCLPVKSLVIDWAGDGAEDERYGAGSSPHYGALSAALRRCGMEQVWAEHANGGRPVWTPSRNLAKQLPLNTRTLWVQGARPRPSLRGPLKKQLLAAEQRLTAATLWGSAAVSHRRPSGASCSKPHHSSEGSMCLASMPDSSDCVVFDAGPLGHALVGAIGRERPRCRIVPAPAGDIDGRAWHRQKDGVQSVYRPVGGPGLEKGPGTSSTLSTAMAASKHKSVDLLLVSAGGMEWRYLLEAFAGPTKRPCPDVRQVVAGLHRIPAPDPRYGDVAAAQTLLVSALAGCGLCLWHAATDPSTSVQWLSFVQSNECQDLVSQPPSKLVAPGVSLTTVPMHEQDLFEYTDARLRARLSWAAPNFTLALGPEVEGCSLSDLAELDPRCWYGLPEQCRSSRGLYDHPICLGLLPKRASEGMRNSARESGRTNYTPEIDGCRDDSLFRDDDGLDCDAWRKAGRYHCAMYGGEKFNNRSANEACCLCKAVAAELKRTEPVGNTNCVAYDFGIRTEPHFGRMLARHGGCEVHAFDPSPISRSGAPLWKAIHGLDGHPKYTFHGVGAGGADTTLQLGGYNWGQVTILAGQASSNSSTAGGQAAEKLSFSVRTLGSIMRERGHVWVDVLKVDVEGSEFAFLEQAFSEFGCLPVGQLTLELHHYGGGDPRYGTATNPFVEGIAALLKNCGHVLVYRQTIDGYASVEDLRKTGAVLYYNLATWVLPYDRLPEAQKRLVVEPRPGA